MESQVLRWSLQDYKGFITIAWLWDSADAPPNSQAIMPLEKTGSE